MSVLPDMSGPVLSWGQKISMVIVGRDQKDYLTEETMVPVETFGVVMPLKPEDLELKPEGERNWVWLNLFCSPSLSLKPGDVIVYNAVRHRIMGRKDYSAYGYLEYELVEDYNS